MLYGRTQYAHPSRFIDEMPRELLDSNISESRSFQAATQPDPTLPARAGRAGALCLRCGPARRRSSPARAQSVPLPDFTAGCRVRHKAFGDGMVVSGGGVKPMGGDALLEIAFDQKGTKRLMGQVRGAVYAENLRRYRIMKAPQAEWCDVALGLSKHFDRENPSVKRI